MAEFLQIMDNWDGYLAVREGRKPNEAAVVRAIELVTNKARMSPYLLRAKIEEAITTSDFPYLFSHIIDRQVLARYQAVVADWQSYCFQATVPDFNTVRRHKIYGQDNILPLVPEKGEYLVSKTGEARYYYNVAKYGRQFDISWEAIINDSLGAMGDIAERFATAVIRSEARFVASLYASAAGPNAALFGAPIVDVDGQAITNLGVLPLTIANLEATLALMARQTDPNGEPIGVRGVHLVVPPDLEFTARQILTSALKMWTESAGGAPTPYPTTNVIPQLGIQLHVDPYLPVVDATATDDTTWYVFADPSQGKAMEFARLRGYETPEICMKASDKVAVTGAPISPFAGDFATDNIFYRVRHILGGVQLDPRFAYAQQAP